MIRSKAGPAVVSAIGLVVIFAFGYYLYVNADKYASLLRVSFLPVVLILTATFLSALVNGCITAYLYRGLGVSLSARDGFFLSSASTLANQLPVSGGMVARAYYLKRRHSLSYAKFISSSVALFICFVSNNGLISVLILVHDFCSTSTIRSPGLLLGFAFMAFSILVFLLPVERVTASVRLHDRLEQILDGWRMIGGKPALLGKVLGLQTVLMLLLAFRYQLAFQMLSQEVSISQAILFSSASVLTQLVSIAPGGLGVTESIVGGVATLLGFETGVSVVAVGLDRLFSTIVILLLGGISVFALGRQFSDT